MKPDFTGSRSHWTDPETVRMAMPFQIRINQVDLVTAGKITKTYFDWKVELRGETIAQRDVFNNRYPRTRKAAITQARRAIGVWVRGLKPC